MNTNALIIIAKHPEKKSVMTRLMDSMTDDKRLEFYIYLLENTIKKLDAIKGIDTFIAYAPDTAREYFGKFGLRLLALPEGDLGVRMLYAFHTVFKKGYKKAALVGVDIPGLTDSIISNAFELLSDSDIVFGPAKDGGYYLAGMRVLIKELFEGIPWSSDETLKKSIENAEIGGYTIALTEKLSDIDTIEDVREAGFLF